MKKSKVNNDPNTMLIQRKYKQRAKNTNNNNISNNASEEYGYETFQNKEIITKNSLYEDIYLGSGEMEDQIQSYKEQLIDAKLKNIKLTNEVQKLKELSKTQMSKFYNGGLNNTNNLEGNEEIQNQTDSMFYKSNNGGNINEQIKIIEEKYEKKINKYHGKIKALKDHNTKLEDLVLKLKDTLDRANEVFPNFLMQLSSNNNSNENNNNDINNNTNNIINKKENPLMVSVGEDPINITPLNDNNNNEQHIKIMEENRQLGSENLELKNVLLQYEEEIDNMKKERKLLGNTFDDKLKLIQKEMELTNQKNEEILNNKIEEFNEDIIKKQKEIDSYKIENNKLKIDNQKYLFQITTLTEEAQQHIEEINILEEQIKNNEYLLKDKNNKDNIIEQLNSEIEKNKIENNEMKKEHINTITEYENKLKNISNENKTNINKINELKLEINNLNKKIENAKKENEDINNENNNKIEEYENKIKLISNENNDNLNKINELKLEIKNLNNTIKRNNN